MNRGVQYSISKFICPDCGKSMYVSRPKGKMRENGHIKDLWCPTCKGLRKMVEIKNW